MNNFPFKHEVDGQMRTLWYSRSVAAGLFVFAKNEHGDWFVLAAKRGTATPVGVGQWNCPGGFVDFNEDLYEAAARECYEETGVSVNSANIHFFGFNSAPNSTRQTIGMRFYTIIEDETVEDLNSDLSFEHNEPNECSDIRWIRVDDIWLYDWTFDHAQIIEKIFNICICPSFLTRLKNAINLILGNSHILNEDIRCRELI